MPDYLRAFEFACKTARSIITGRDAPVLPGPLDDGDLLAQAEEERDAWEPREAEPCPQCVEYGYVKTPRQAVKANKDRPFIGDDYTTHLLPQHRGSQWIGHAGWVYTADGEGWLGKLEGQEDIWLDPRNDTSCYGPYTKSPDVAGATAASVEDPPVEVPPASTGADSEPDWKTLFQNGVGRIMAIPEPEIGVLVPPTVTRVVLVHGTHGGRSVTERWAEEWDVRIQDDGRTLKLFSKNPTGPRYEHTPGFFDLPDIGGPW